MSETELREKIWSYFQALRLIVEQRTSCRFQPANVAGLIDSSFGGLDWICSVAELASSSLNPGTKSQVYNSTSLEENVKQLSELLNSCSFEASSYRDLGSFAAEPSTLAALGFWSDTLAHLKAMIDSSKTAAGANANTAMASPTPTRTLAKSVANNRNSSATPQHQYKGHGHDYLMKSPSHRGPGAGVGAYSVPRSAAKPPVAPLAAAMSPGRSFREAVAGSAASGVPVPVPAAPSMVPDLQLMPPPSTVKKSGGVVGLLSGLGDLAASTLGSHAVEELKQRAAEWEHMAKESIKEAVALRKQAESKEQALEAHILALQKKEAELQNSLSVQSALRQQYSEEMTAHKAESTIRAADADAAIAEAKWKVGALTAELATVKSSHAAEASDLQAKASVLATRISSLELELQSANHAGEAEVERVRGALAEAHATELARLEVEKRSAFDAAALMAQEQQEQVKAGYEAQLAALKQGQDAVVAAAVAEAEAAGASRLQLAVDEATSLSRQISELHEQVQALKLQLAEVQAEKDAAIADAAKAAEKAEEAKSAAEAQVVAAADAAAASTARVGAALASVRSCKTELTGLTSFVKSSIADTMIAFGAFAVDLVDQVKKAKASAEEANARYVREQTERRHLQNQVAQLKGNIRVLARIRPVAGKEELAGDAAIVKASGNQEIVVEEVTSEGGVGGSSKGRIMESKSFEFDGVFDAGSNQASVYREVSPLVTSALDGYHSTIFAYGQTGSGKTYTMEGPVSDRGVYFRALSDLFSQVQERSGSVEGGSEWCYSLRVSMVEIYNEAICDLLRDQPSSSSASSSSSAMDEDDDSAGLEIKLAKDGSVCLPDATCIAVTSQSEVEALMIKGAHNRSVGRTNANEHSSRSHSLLMITIEGENAITKERSAGKLTLVDLAGSERVSKTGAEGVRLHEAKNINKSLSALGDVIAALASKQAHVPFRNSKLTHLLSDSLGKDNKTLMIVQVSPVASSRGETLCSLNFASRVKKVELGKAVKHGDNGKAARLEGEVARLREANTRLAEEAASSVDERKGHTAKIADLSARINTLEAELAKASAAAASAEPSAASKAAAAAAQEVAVKRAVEDAVSKLKAGHDAAMRKVEAEKAKAVTEAAEAAVLRRKLADAATKLEQREAKAKDDIAAAVQKEKVAWERQQAAAKAKTKAAKRKSIAVPGGGRKSIVGLAFASTLSSIVGSTTASSTMMASMTSVMDADDHDGDAASIAADHEDGAASLEMDAATAAPASSAAAVDANELDDEAAAAAGIDGVDAVDEAAEVIESTKSLLQEVKAITAAEGSDVVDAEAAVVDDGAGLTEADLAVDEQHAVDEAAATSPAAAPAAADVDLAGSIVGAATGSSAITTPPCMTPAGQQVSLATPLPMATPVSSLHAVRGPTPFKAPFAAALDAEAGDEEEDDDDEANTSVAVEVVSSGLAARAAPTPGASSSSSMLSMSSASVVADLTSMSTSMVGGGAPTAAAAVPVAGGFRFGSREQARLAGLPSPKPQGIMKKKRKSGDMSTAAPQSSTAAAGVTVEEPSADGADATGKRVRRKGARVAMVSPESSTVHMIKAEAAAAEAAPPTPIGPAAPAMTRTSAKSPAAPASSSSSVFSRLTSSSTAATRARMNSTATTSAAASSAAAATVRPAPGSALKRTASVASMSENAAGEATHAAAASSLSSSSGLRAMSEARVNAEAGAVAAAGVGAVAGSKRVASAAGTAPLDAAKKGRTASTGPARVKMDATSGSTSAGGRAASSSRGAGRVAVGPRRV